MNRVSIIVILCSALLSPCGWAQTVRTAIPGADQDGTNQIPVNQTPNNANEDSDLARIPNPQPATATHANAASTGVANERIYLENAFTQIGQRGGLIVLSPQ